MLLNKLFPVKTKLDKFMMTTVIEKKNSGSVAIGSQKTHGVVQRALVVSEIREPSAHCAITLSVEVCLELGFAERVAHVGLLSDKQPKWNYFLRSERPMMVERRAF